MYAVIETGGKQYRVAPGQTIEVDTIEGEIGSGRWNSPRVLALVESKSNELLLGDAIGGAKVVRAKSRSMAVHRKLLFSSSSEKSNTNEPVGTGRTTPAFKVEEILA